jgi:hypothetical protein
MAIGDHQVFAAVVVRVDDGDSRAIASHPGPRLSKRLYRSCHPHCETGKSGARSPAHAANDPVLAEFLRSTLLRGNGTLLLSNTFVEWSTVNVARRARPVVTIASFGLHNQLKPFSNLLIYSDQDAASAAPAPPDLDGTHTDLEMLYQYVWQEFGKLAE